MKIKWENYINKNLYSECQLITALNAYYYLTGKTYCKQNDKEYEKLVDLVCARNGSAINIERAHRRLKLKIIGKVSHWSLIGDVLKKIELPLEVSLWHKKTGYHSVLIVDYSSKVEAIQITNFRYETTNRGWFFLEDLYKFWRNSPGMHCRFFGLRGQNYNEYKKILKNL